MTTMKLFLLFALALCCATTFAVPLEDKLIDPSSIDELRDEDFDLASIDELMNADDDFEYLPDEDGEGGDFLDETVARFIPHKGGFPFKKKPRRRKRFPRRLRVQLKVFNTTSGAPRYKIYILQGRNIRHYRVTFRTSQQSKFRKSVQRRTVRCLKRNYRSKCRKLKKLFLRRRCSDRITKDCVGSFDTFEIANPKTRGKDAVEPKKKRRKHKRFGSGFPEPTDFTG